MVIHFHLTINLRHSLHHDKRSDRISIAKHKSSATHNCRHQDLYPPGVGGGANFHTNALESNFMTTSKVKRKRIGRSPPPDCAALTSKTHAITSMSVFAPVPCSPPHYHVKQRVLNPPRTNGCSCSSSDTDNIAEISYEEQSFLDSDSNSEEEGVECFGQGDAELDSGQAQSEDGIGIHITKIGKRSRRIESSIQINASLSTIWNVLTDYERLADFIPGLALSRLVEKRDNCARLYQIGQQDLALGFKFNAKALLDCYEMDLENHSFGQKRDIEFKMVEGDFEIFEGKWSIQQNAVNCCEDSKASSFFEGLEYETILSYVVEVKPKLWLPVRLVEGRLCSEIKTNLSSIRREAQIRSQSS